MSVPVIMDAVEAARSCVTEWQATCALSYSAVQRYVSACEARAAAGRAPTEAAGALAREGSSVLAAEACLADVQECMTELQRIADRFSAMALAAMTQAHDGG